MSEEVNLRTSGEAEAGTDDALTRAALDYHRYPRPGKIAGQIQEARGAGHRYLLLWSWRGHEPTGDGFAVKPYAAELGTALQP